MDNVSRMEDLKLDSHSEMIDKDDGGKDLFSPAMIPLNTPTIGSKPEESESEDDEESEDEEIENTRSTLAVATGRISASVKSKYTKG
ncbi:unnamed protein product [Prunus armeniaca]|uniref:Uncharacterized protein n=1 Tax=Prunus armeniaca TaxID=36596 RepID=A0A6J5XHI9_PRUAR|nr:unnamed protein product [Prunus armeniaca]